MRKNKLILSIVLLINPLISYASNWASVTYTEDTAVEIDTTSIKKIDNNKIQFIDRYLKIAVSNSKGEAAPEVTNISITSNIADCAKQSAALVSAIKHDIKQKSTKEYNAPSIVYEPIPADSIMGTELKFVCNYNKIP